MNVLVRIRIELDKMWSAKDMVDSLNSIEDLYNLLLVLNYAKDYPARWETECWKIGCYSRLRLSLRRLTRQPSRPPAPLDSDRLRKLVFYLYPRHTLQLKEIRYGSPGYKDILGLGSALGHILRFILQLVKHRADRNSRQLCEDRLALKNDEQALRNELLRVRVHREQVKLAKECGYTKHDLQKLMDYVELQEVKLLYLVESGRIAGAALADENSELTTED